MTLVEALRELHSATIDRKRQSEAGRVLMGEGRRALEVAIRYSIRSPQEDWLEEAVELAIEACCTQTEANAFRGESEKEAITWLGRIAVNKYIDQTRKAKRAATRPLADDEDPALAFDRVRQAEAQDELKRLDTLLKKILLSAPNAKRRRIEVFIRYRRGQVEPEIANDETKSETPLSEEARLARTREYADRYRGRKDILEQMESLDLGDEDRALLQAFAAPPRGSDVREASGGTSPEGKEEEA